MFILKQMYTLKGVIMYIWSSAVWRKQVVASMLIRTNQLTPFYVENFGPNLSFEVII
jgi:hypothetical protein